MKAACKGQVNQSTVHMNTNWTLAHKRLEHKYCKWQHKHNIHRLQRHRWGILIEAFSFGSSAARKRDNSDTAITPWWMSCDRHRKLLLGGFWSSVEGLYISKVKSKLCTQPILSFAPSVCCGNTPSFVHTHTHARENTQTPPPPVPFSCCVRDGLFIQIPISLNDTIAQWQNMAICPSLVPTARS